MSRVLGACHGREFERLCHGLLSPFIEGLKADKELGKIDQSGVDIYVLAEDGLNFTTAIQCKGFDLDFGESQLAQCLKSIETFRKSGRRAAQYSLIANRSLIDADIRKTLTKAVEQLETDGLADTAQLLPIEPFVDFIFDLSCEWVANRLLVHAAQMRDAYAKAMDWTFYIPDIPYTVEHGEAAEQGGPLQFLRNDIAKLNINALSQDFETLKAHEEELSQNENLREVLKRIPDKPKELSIRDRVFVVSEFGFGKTSLLLTGLENLKEIAQYVIYLPMTQFSETAFTNEKDMVADILASLFEEDDVFPINLSKQVLRDALVKILRRRSSTVLLIDGLDEHPYSYRDDGLQRILDCFAEFQSYCVFSVRKEFWRERYGNVTIALRAHKKRSNFVQLEEWAQPQLEAYLSHYEAHMDETSPETFKSFATIIRSFHYEDHFGDIPKRPLFLKMLSDSALEGETETQNISEIYYNYFLRKLAFDHYKIADQDDTGRPRIFEGMDANAKSEKIIDILCDLAEAQSGTFHFPQNEISDATTIVEIYEEFTEADLRNVLQSKGVDNLSVISFLENSILIPSGPRLDGNMGLRFAHKSFHECFLALRLYRNGRNVPRTSFGSSLKKFYKGFEASPNFKRHPP